MTIRLLCCYFFYILALPTHSFAGELPLGAGSFIYKNTNSLNVAAYNIYGHSAGAQFVHRLVLIMPESRIDKAIAAKQDGTPFLILKPNFPLV